jgi:hypothetical protein
VRLANPPETLASFGDREVVRKRVPPGLLALAFLVTFSGADKLLTCSNLRPIDFLTTHFAEDLRAFRTADVHWTLAGYPGKEAWFTDHDPKPNTSALCSRVNCRLHT